MFRQLKRLAMEPMGRLAGTASAIIGTLSSLVSVILEPNGQSIRRKSGHLDDGFGLSGTSGIVRDAAGGRFEAVAEDLPADFLSIISLRFGDSLSTERNF